jgi:hypothetical protein
VDGSGCPRDCTSQMSAPLLVGMAAVLAVSVIGIVVVVEVLLTDRGEESDRE